MAALVSIGGFDFPEPSTYNATTSTIVDSARNVQGRVVGGLPPAIVSSENQAVSAWNAVKSWRKSNTNISTKFNISVAELAIV